MKMRRRFPERFKWRMNDRLPGQTLKRKKWIVALIVWTAVFDWFFILFGIDVILPYVLGMAPPYLPKKYAQVYTHISTLEGYISEHNPVLAFSPDSKTLATSGHREVRLWDVETGEHLLTLETNMNQVMALAFHSDGKTVVGVSAQTSSRGGYQFMVWNISSPNLKPAGPAQPISRGETRISQSDEDTLPRQANTSQDTVAVFSQDRTNFISLGHSGSVWEYDLVHDRLVHQQVIGLKPLKRMQFATFHFATRPSDRISTRWNSEKPSSTSSPTPIPTPIVLNRQGTRSLSFLTAPAHQVRGLTFSPDGKMLASGGYRSELRLWDIAFGEIRLWDIDSSRQIALMPVPYGSVKTLAFSPDRKTLASGNSRGMILIWDLASSGLVSIITESGSDIAALAFAPDSITLASVNSYGTVRLWDITGRTKR